MKHKSLSVLLVLAVLLGSFSAGQNIQRVHAADSKTCYVDINASGANNGSSWGDAYQDLQLALSDLTCTEIHVAAGTYYPSSTKDFTESFVLRSGLSLIGGYSAYGGGDTPDPSVNLTILDGNINPSDPTYNTFNVVKANNIDSTAVLDGFTIQNGHAYSDMNVPGGGITIINGSPILRNLVISNNSSKDDGGGMYISRGNPTLTNVTFQGNQATSNNGGGLYIDRGNVSLADSHFDGNTAGSNGAGIYLFGGNLDMWNTRLENGNSSGYGGGLFIDTSGSATIRGGTIKNNFAYLYGGGLMVLGSIAMAGVTVSGNSAPSGGGGIFLSGSASADFANLVIDQNQASSGFGGGVGASVATAQFTNLLLSGNTAGFGGGGMSLNSSDITIVNATIVRNDAGSTGIGQALYSDSTLNLANSIVWDQFNAPSIDVSVATSANITDSLLEDGCPAGATCAKLVSSDPQFVDPQLGDYRLSPDSPAVDAGDVSALPSDTYDLDGDGNVTERIAWDLRGKPRVAIGGVDIGAYEVQAGNINWTEATDIPLVQIQPDVYSNILGRYLDRQGQSQWFKFTIQPDSKVLVTLTGLAANFDLSLYKDISQTYDELNSSQDLVKLSAEFAPDTFSPDTFSPDTFSPDTFSPDTFSPDTFSPDTFSPDTFSPDTFSPDTFSPDTFSPDTFSPDIFASAQTRSLIAVSAHDGTQGESIIVNTWTKSGDFYLRVRGRNGAFASDTPFQLRVTMLSGTCGSVSPLLPASDTELVRGGYQTLILTNLGQTEGTIDEKKLLQNNLAALAARTNGWVVDVGADAQVSAASLQAQANPACVYAMNLQAGAIKNIADNFRQLNPGLEYIVLVGNDHAIPFFRYADNALLASEIEYSPPVLDNTTSQASLKSGYTLSQDAYGASGEVSYKAVTLPIPELAVGRLVETASDINHLLDAYLGTAEGVVYPTNALVTGYDFLADDANAVRDQLRASLGGSAVDTLIMDRSLSPEDPSAWTADDLRHSLLNSRHGLVFLAGHFSASSTLAADYTTHLLASEVLASTTDFTNTLVYSAGCHSGFNIVNADDVSNVTQEPDWAQVFAAKGATFIGGTGYQYGDTDFIEYSERLYLEFTQQLRYGSGPVSVGKALVQAKQAYLANTPLMRGIHEKTVLEATLFGLPMLQFDLSGRIPAPVDVSLVTHTTTFTADPGLTLGLEYADLHLAPTFTFHTVTLDQTSGNGDITTVNAVYLQGPDGVVVNPAEPVMPLDMLNVTSPEAGFVLRGIGWRGGVFTDLLDQLPLTGAATDDLRSPHSAFFSDIFYPVRPWNVNYFDALQSGGGPTRLALMPAQYRSSAPGSLTGVLRRFDALDFRLYYSSNINTYINPDKNWSNTPALSAPPDISNVSSSVNTDGLISFEVTVTGDPAAGIQEAWIVYTFENGGLSGTWLPLDLQQDPVDTRLWKGTLNLHDVPAADLRFIVQAVNGVGLVTMMTNEGAFYRAGVDPAAPPQGLLPVTLTLDTPAASGPYGGQQAFTAVVTRDGAPLAGLPVMFNLGGQARMAVTGGDGRATVNFFLVAQPGEYTLEAAFNGNDAYASASGSSPFEIDQGTSLVVLEPGVQTVLPGVSTQFTATVTSAGLPLVGKSVALTLDAGGVRQVTSLAVTDYAGRAVWQVPAQPPGTYELKAWFGLPVTDDLDLSSPFYTGSFDTASLVVSRVQTFTLSVSRTGTGGGVVSSSPEGINCGSDCSEVYAGNTVVTLTATPFAGSTFTGWSGACSATGPCPVTVNTITLTMDANKSVTANFDLQNFTLSVGKAGTGFGTVTSAPAGIDCGLDCSEAYPYNTSVTLVAASAPGSTFTGWSGACSGIGACTVTMDANKSVIANFEGPQQAFADVSPGHWAFSWIMRLYQAGLTNGCSTDPLRYCPEDLVTRAEMAVFLERGIHGSGFTPPRGSGTIFADVPLSYWAVNWIEKLYADGVTDGCGTSPLSYCPEASVTRAQMAIFLLRARHGAAYTPPAVGSGTGFNDVSAGYWAAAWIKQLTAEGITNGCGSGNYCPENPITRAEMAKFLVLTFDLP